MTARHIPPTLLLLAILGSPGHAAPTASEPRLVRVDLDAKVTAMALLRAGLDVVELRHGSHAVLLEWPGDAARLAALGASARVLDEAPGRTAANATRAELGRRPRRHGQRVWSAVRPDGVYRVETLPEIGDGSLGGFWSLAEVKMKLDALVAGDNQGVVADKIDTIGASLGPWPQYPSRPIWGLALGKAVIGPDTRPAVLYLGLTHAREPAGMHAVLYFAEDLVSRYGTDPEATYLLDHRRIYIVPVANPDGYKFNEDLYYINGGNYFGMQRRNLRDTNGNGILEANIDGVDLNRNYGYLWGLNDVGSSPDPTAGNYRGTGPFSEPETQAVRDAVVALQPRAALDFHSYSDMLLYPWSYTAQASEDSAAFVEWSDEMTAGNGYQTGQGTRVLYETNGDFTDWAYGDIQLKPRVLAWTSEVGGPSDLFWPPPSRIAPLAEENLRACYHTAYIVGASVRVEEHHLVEGVLPAGSVAHLELRARNQGVGGTAGPGLTANLSSLSAGANVAQGTASLPTLGPLESAASSSLAEFVISADDTVTPGRVLRFRADFTAPDGYFSRDTIDVVCGVPTTLVVDDAAGLGNWTGKWVIETSDPMRSGPHFSDRAGTYKPNSSNSFTLTSPLDLSSGVHAYATFLSRWEFETDYDCGLIEASLDGVSWTPLSGTGTTLGNTGGEQPPGLPVYGGTRRLWGPERADLSPFAGPGASTVRLRWRVLSDTGGQFDGFRFDSLRISVFDPASQPTPVSVGGPRPMGIELQPLSPNPAGHTVRIGFAIPREMDVRLEVFDLEGRRVRCLAIGPRPAGRYAQGWDLRDEDGRPVASGLYHLRLTTVAESRARSLVVLR